MQDFDNIYAIGLMSDTDLEGINAALIKTNGLDSLEILDNIARPYDEHLLEQIKNIRGNHYSDFPKKLKKAEFDFTMANARIVEELLNHAQIEKNNVKIIGFHGLTLHHSIAEKKTFQLGDPRLLTMETRLPVVARFRNNDVFNGGYGGPLTPIYLANLYAKETRPLAILNISGFAKATFIDENERLSAGLIGPAMTLLNDFMIEHFNLPMDYDGAIAAKGTVNQKILQKMLQDEYFTMPIPKYVSRSYFNKFFQNIQEIDKQEAISTLTALVAEVILQSIGNYPKVVISGGGVKNPTLMRILKMKSNLDLVCYEDIGYNAKMIEAQAFAYLAVRNLYNLPSSFPETTNTTVPTICGAIYETQ